MNALLDEFGRGDAREREESWRYSRTALRALDQQTFSIADPSAELPDALKARFDWPETHGKRLVFVNGGLSERHSNFDATSLLAIEHRRVSTSMRVSGGALHLVFVSVPGTEASRWRRELTIEVEGQNAELIEHHVGEPGSDILAELRSTIRLSNQSSLHITTLSELPDSASLYRRDEVRIGERARYSATHALFGGRMQRFDLDVDIGAGAAYESRGVFALRGRQHLDVHLDARHTARDARSDVVWRGVADQRARGILRGAITVAEGADGADAQLQTKNILLSPHAEIDAQPVLEIYADEVKASHGATIGQLDERALFYLRSRGVTLTEARDMLIVGFCRDVLASHPNAALRERLDAALSAQLPRANEVQP